MLEIKNNRQDNSATRYGNSIQTWSGIMFYPLDPKSEEVSIYDIAHALSNKCRFTGHVRSFYSVAQHSVLVSKNCNPKDALWGLLHDASEAYLADMAKPIKVMPEFQKFREIENGIQRVICQHFGLSFEEPKSVKDADTVLLLTEKRDLMLPVEWKQFDYEAYSPIPEKITPLLPYEARELFLSRFEELTRAE